MRSINLIKPVIAAVALAVVSACSVGIKEGDIDNVQSVFDVPITYQEAYRRADQYARHCYTTNSLLRGSFVVDGDIYTDNETGVIRIGFPGKDFARIELKANGGGTNVTITSWVGLDENGWDEREIAAARSSIESGIPVCRRTSND